MPELPEVETIKNDLKAKVINNKIKIVYINLPKIVKNKPGYFQEKMTGAVFSHIERRGKLLIFSFRQNNLFMLLHLRMTGQLIYKKGRKIIGGGHSDTKIDFNLPNKYSHLWFEFVDGGKLFFNDMRQFGYARLVNNEEKKEALKVFGPEPFEKKFSSDYLYKELKKRRISVKAVLLNQHIIAGIGNIYADEALFLAGIRPNRPAKQINRKEVQRLFLAIKKILRLAIKDRGTTFNNYVDVDGRRGGFLKKLKVYKRAGQKCQKCKQVEIKKTKVAGRGTHYCPICQK